MSAAVYLRQCKDMKSLAKNVICELLLLVLTIIFSLSIDYSNHLTHKIPENYMIFMPSFVSSAASFLDDLSHPPLAIDINRAQSAHDLDHVHRRMLLYEFQVDHPLSESAKPCLPPASFKFQLAIDTLALGSAFPAIKARSELAPVCRYSC